jgi:hypothetical protein
VTKACVWINRTRILILIPNRIPAKVYYVRLPRKTSAKMIFFSIITPKRDFVLTVNANTRVLLKNAPMVAIREYVWRIHVKRWSVKRRLPKPVKLPTPCGYTILQEFAKMVIVITTVNYWLVQSVTTVVARGIAASTWPGSIQSFKY